MSEVRSIDLGKLRAYGQAIFKPYEGHRLMELTESVKAYGVITPILVRTVEEGYEVLSGHNRLLAAKTLGHEAIPAIVLGQMSDDEAAFIVTESNMMQRGFMEMAITERAKCVALRHQAMVSEKIRQKLVDTIEALLGDSSDKVTDLEDTRETDFDLSATTIKRYIRIECLCESLKPYVDDDRIGMVAASDLSYLEAGHQEMLAAILNESDYKVNKSEAKKLRQLEAEGLFSEDKVILTLFRDTAAHPVQFKLSRGIMSRYLSGYSSEEAMDVIEQALNMWFNRGNQVG